MPRHYKPGFPIHKSKTEKENPFSCPAFVVYLRLRIMALLLLLLIVETKQ